MPENTNENTPEFFAENFHQSVNCWSYMVIFQQRPFNATNNEVHKDLVRIRMPLETAKAYALMLLRSIREYESSNNIKIDLPDQVLEGLNIPKEDWRS